MAKNGTSATNQQFTYDLKDNRLFTRDRDNFILALGSEQLNTISNVYLLDVYLNKGKAVELHYHPNATELIYCIAGSAIVAFINLDTNQWREFPITSGQVVSIPQGWWHEARATADHTHLLAIHNTAALETIFGSDILRLTPPGVLAHMYCLDERKVKEALSPITGTTIIGPPKGCRQRNNTNRENQQLIWDHPGKYSMPK